MGIADDLAAYIAGAKDKWQEQTLRARFWRGLAVTYTQNAVDKLGLGEEVEAGVWAQLALVAEMARQAADIERPSLVERGREVLPTQPNDP
jgi:hypothetical protein